MDDGNQSHEVTTSEECLEKQGRILKRPVS